MITIKSNTSALTAQNNLFANQKALQGNMLQLSTGLRINSASDDAADMQIANRMNTQINGLGVAQRNANDGISMAQTAEGAMQETSNIMNRMRDLALQSANDTNTQKDRDAMQGEVKELKAEINRIRDKTNFAGIDLFHGDKSSADGKKEFSFQVGSNANETISFKLSDMSTKNLGKIDSITVVEESTEGKVDSTAANELYKDWQGGKAITISTSDDKDSVTIPADANKSNIDKSFEDFASSLNTAIGDKYSNLNVTANSNNELVITNKENNHRDAKIKFVVGGEDKATITLDKKDAIIEENASVDKIDITSKENAQASIKVLDKALEQVDGERAHLGAVQNRLESTVNNLSNIQENMTASKSRILDTDFASQTVQMTSNQMLMQAGTTILSQAKGMPQNAVMLLR